MLYRQLLKDDFERLAPALRRLHETNANVRARGVVSIRHQNRWLARLAGFPKQGDKIPLDLAVECGSDTETWTRRFDGLMRRSVQSCAGGLMIEQLGPLRLQMRIYADGEDLRLESTSAKWLKLPAPVRVRAVERARGANGWEFEVEVRPVGSYKGVMEILP
jgi:hypothetical protein